MAYLELKNGVKRHITSEQGIKLWNGLHDPSSIDDTQRDYLATVKSIHLNWHNAPDSYVKENLDLIIPAALNDWIVDNRGHVVKPGSVKAWNFAKRWGLWELGKPSSLVSPHAIITQSAFPVLKPVNYSEASSAQ